jgi:hypothetical protein
MASDRIHLTVAEAREHSERALRGIGYDAEEAHILADHMIDAALCGYEYSGLAKILNIPEHRRFKRPRRPMTVIRETEVSALYDGGNNVGMLAMYHAARAAIAKAGSHGFSVVGVTNSWMSGRSAYYCEMIANADLVGIHICGRPPSRKAWQREWLWSVAVICPAFGCGTDGRWPRWVARIGSRTPYVMSEHHWIPRGVPILGRTDRHLAASLQAPGR